MLSLIPYPKSTKIRMPPSPPPLTLTESAKSYLKNLQSPDKELFSNIFEIRGKRLIGL